MKTIGIIGGMGPYATLDFFKKILDESKVEKDQDHLHLIIDNYPQVPDRTKYILSNGQNPYPYILESANRLTNNECDLLCMPCNTAHYFIKKLLKDLTKSIEFIDMIESVKEYIYKNYKNIDKILVLGTDGLVKSHIYNEYFGKFPLEYPNFEEQKQIMEIILTVKKGDIKKAANSFIGLINKLSNYKNTILIAACTELSILLPFIDNKDNIIDSNLILAKKVVKLAYERS
ncbi:MAG: amino acid racemase [Deferribacterota bacterium]|nr:amino acid racemase [Deferribacterota bacterium]